MTTATAQTDRGAIIQARWETATTRPVLYSDGSHTLDTSKRYQRIFDDIRALGVHVAGDLVTEEALDALAFDVDAFVKARVIQLAEETAAAVAARRSAD